MMWAISIALLILFSFIIYEDFKYHAITWFIVPLIFILVFFNGIIQINFKILMGYFLINSGIIILQLLGLIIYFYFKEKRITGIINKQLGLGDILILFAMALFFAPVNFVLFILISLILTLLVSIIKFSVFPKRNRQIPLAGYWGIYMNLLILAQLFNPIISYYQITYFEDLILRIT